jgi:hypothetical protein
MVFDFGRGRFSAAPKPWWRPRLSPVLQGGAFSFVAKSSRNAGHDLTAIGAQDEESS